MWWIILVALQEPDTVADLMVRTAPPFSMSPADRIEEIAPYPSWPFWLSGRVVTQPFFHLGARPHFFASSDDGSQNGAAITVQIRYDEILWLVGIK